MPTPLEDGAALDAVLNVLKSNSKNLTYAVTDFPLDFQ